MKTLILPVDESANKLKQKGRDTVLKKMAEIVKTEGVLSGKARIEGKRISVYQIGEMVLEAGFSPERVADQLDLSLGEVYSALAYYYEHLDEMEEIRKRWAKIEEDLKRDSKAPRKVEH
ncbi:MAG: hypothetical protein MAG715_01271 [Methanonatronarchaeales archaeon]|nr:hypothetical protein [Methanonatronarchaeales archaeon]